MTKDNGGVINVMISFGALALTLVLAVSKLASVPLNFTSQQTPSTISNWSAQNATGYGQDQYHKIEEISSCLLTISQSEPSENTLDIIRRAKKEYGFQQSLSERALLYEGFRCFDFNMSLLIWGTGRDTMWFSTINNGKTRFLEDLPDWIEFGNKNLSKLDRDAKIYEIGFNTTMRNEHSYFDNMDALIVDLPDDILTTKWDFILVDAPRGYRDNLPGRMQSIVTTRRLRQRHQLSPPYYPRVAAVHDMERHVERTWGEAIFGRTLQCWEKMCIWEQ